MDRELLKVVLQQPQAVSADFDDVAPEAFAHPAYVAVARAVSATGGVARAVTLGSGWVDGVSSMATDDAVRALVTELAVEPVRTDDTVDDRYAREQLASYCTVSIIPSILGNARRL